MGEREHDSTQLLEGDPNHPPLDGTAQGGAVHPAKARTFRERFFAVGMMVAGAFFYSLLAVFFKLARRLPPIQLQWSRGIAQTLFIVPILFYRRIPPFAVYTWDWSSTCGRKRGYVPAAEDDELQAAGVAGATAGQTEAAGGPDAEAAAPSEKDAGAMMWLNLRGLAGFAANACYYFALKSLSLGDAQALMMTATLWTAVLGWMILGERLSKPLIALGCLAMLGILFVSQPQALFPHKAESVSTNTSDPRERWIAIFVLLLQGPLSGLVFVAVRLLHNRASVSSLIFHYGVYTLVLCPMTAIWQPFLMPRGALEWVGVIGVGVSGVCGQVLFTIGSQRELASIAAVVENTDVIFALVLQIVFLHDIPNAWTLLGCVCIGGSVTVISIIRARAEDAGAEAAASAIESEPDVAMELVRDASRDASADSVDESPSGVAPKPADNAGELEAEVPASRTLSLGDR
eukprot:c8453_g1_i1.p1 GENE.c8453_g1_i1~~c8453_g1_i1.p1  ORF type:complete len:460 (+),score=58.79 c8453_g1_i1:155-1534(+)